MQLSFRTIKITDVMDRAHLESVQDPPNLIRTGASTVDRLLSHIDPGPQEESEEFVRRIYEQRCNDLSAGTGQTGN